MHNEKKNNNVKIVSKTISICLTTKLLSISLIPLQATRDRLTQSRLEKKGKQTTPTPVKPNNNDSDTDDIPLSCLKAKSKSSGKKP